MGGRRGRKLASLLVIPLVIGVPGAAAEGPETVTLSAGTEVELELLHHLNSKYSPTGSNVYFHVARDVVAEGEVVIPEGTLVVGHVAEAMKSKSMGRAGSMTISIKTLEAVDGTLIPVDADLASKGRTRTGATVGMVVAFGLPGLFSKGRMAFSEKGTMYSATASIDREINPGNAKPVAEEVLAAPLEGRMSGPGKPVELKIEKGKQLDPLEFTVEPPSGYALADLDLHGMRLVKAGDVTVPEEIAPLSVRENKVVFDAWPVLKYCGAGQTILEFRAPLGDGNTFGAPAALTLQIEKKEEKKK